MPEPEYKDLRSLITEALDGSIDKCARCKTCDNQVDAVMEVLTDENARMAIVEAVVQSFTDNSQAALKVTINRDTPGEVTVVLNADDVVDLKDDDAVTTVRVSMEIPGGETAEVAVLERFRMEDWPPPDSSMN